MTRELIREMIHPYAMEILRQYCALTQSDADEILHVLKRIVEERQDMKTQITPQEIEKVETGFHGLNRRGRRARARMLRRDGRTLDRPSLFVVERGLPNYVGEGDGRVYACHFARHITKRARATVFNFGRGIKHTMSSPFVSLRFG